MSRALKFVLNKFDEAARQVDNWRSHLSELCELIILLMTSMPPREKPLLAFIFVYDAEQSQIFPEAISVPDILIDIWKQEVGEQLICQIELFAFLAVRFCYADRMHNRAVIAWIDNEAARFAAAKELLHPLLWRP